MVLTANNYICRPLKRSSSVCKFNEKSCTKDRKYIVYCIAPFTKSTT